MVARIVVLSAALLCGAGYVRTASKMEVVLPRTPLVQLPLEIGAWRGQDSKPFAPDILAVLGVDEHVNRVYELDRSYTSLYIGYYGSQRQGDTIHSPLNCLPGSGWEPLSKSYLTIPVAIDEQTKREVIVNRYVVQKGLDQYVVLYWYQSHGRVVANEYRSKGFMVYDAFRLNRTDAALVRVMSRRIGSGPDAEADAGARAVAFVQAMFPLLGKFLPS
jgi:EpsI family protein